MLKFLTGFVITGETVLWSGVKKGPPRALKFPDVQEITNKIQEKLDIQ